jgi:S-adenosylmethionine:tRNA ribosyltransferase-isomerase
MSVATLETPIREADRTPEDRGLARDGVRLLVSVDGDDQDAVFSDLPDLLAPGDLLVVNESATLPASLPAVGRPGAFRLHVSTRYDADLWVVEPRWTVARPGPVGLRLGEVFRVGEVPVRLIAPFPGIERLAFLRADGDLVAEMARIGRPIRYGYLAREYPLEAYQTVFARVPGSAEMPSAGRPFTRALLDRLAARGVEIAPIVLHAGVSSLEADAIAPGASPVYPEPFEVPRVTVDAIERARAGGHRVVAVGTTVVRALESAVDACGLRATRGFTRLYLHAGRPVRVIDGLVTGFHADRTTHLDLLAALARRERLAAAYRHARAAGYLWHEFGDSHLILAS